MNASQLANFLKRTDAIADPYYAIHKLYIGNPPLELLNEDGDPLSIRQIGAEEQARLEMMEKISANAWVWRVRLVGPLPDINAPMYLSLDGGLSKSPVGYVYHVAKHGAYTLYVAQQQA